MGADVYLFPTIIALGFACYVIFLNFKGCKLRGQAAGVLNKALLGAAPGHGHFFLQGRPHMVPCFGQVDKNQYFDKRDKYDSLELRPCCCVLLAGG